MRDSSRKLRPAGRGVRLRSPALGPVSAARRGVADASLELPGDRDPSRPRKLNPRRSSAPPPTPTTCSTSAAAWPGVSVVGRPPPGRGEQRRSGRECALLPRRALAAGSPGPQAVPPPRLPDAGPRAPGQGRRPPPGGPLPPRAAAPARIPTCSPGAPAPCERECPHLLATPFPSPPMETATGPEQAEETFGSPESESFSGEKARRGCWPGGGGAEAGRPL